LVMWFLFHEEPLIRLSLSRLRLHAAELREIFSIGAPAGLQGMMFSLSNVAIQAAINGFGSSAVAGSAAALNFEFVTFLLTDAFCQAVTTFTSQNYGAGKEERCTRVFWLGMGAALLLKSSAIALSWLFRSPLVAVFTVDPAVVPYAMARLRYVLLWAVVSVPFGVAGAAMRGLAHSMVPAVITVVGTCLFRFVWLWSAFQKWHSFECLMFVYPVSWVLTSVMMMAAYCVVRRRAFAAID
ncbi:MAG: MATE family efflux transporter, partial [Pyramidobacter sp.]|nr:MATE family efflux transporter [Pyramidobacter sp.]